MVAELGPHQWNRPRLPGALTPGFITPLYWGHGYIHHFIERTLSCERGWHLYLNNVHTKVKYAFTPEYILHLFFASYFSVTRRKQYLFLLLLPQEEIKSRLKLGNACYYSVQNLLSSRLLSKNLKIKIYRTITLPVVFMGVKHGRWHWGRNAGWGCLRIGCWGEYLDLRGTRW